MRQSGLTWQGVTVLVERNNEVWKGDLPRRRVTRLEPDDPEVLAWRQRLIGEVHVVR